MTKAKENIATAMNALKGPPASKCIDEVHALVEGCVPIIWTLTHEETRFIEEFKDKVADPLDMQVWLWSSYQGLVRLTQQMDVTMRAQGDYDKSWNPQLALERIAKMQVPEEVEGICYILRDFHTVLQEPIPRQIRDIYDYLIGERKTLIVTSPVIAHGPAGKSAGLPPTLEKQITVVRYELPSSEAIDTHVRGIVDQMKDNATEDDKQVRLDYNGEEVHDIVRAVQGMTMQEVENSIATSLAQEDEISVPKLITDKRQILRKSEILEFVDSPVSMADVGGLDNAKEYLNRYMEAQSDAAAEFGVEPLKGLLLTGVPGTGKSLLAKVIGKLWKVPLLKLDVGKVMTGLVGGSEGKMRDVINTAEAMAPCALWIDEVEKSLSGTKSSNFSDGGTLSRVFGTLLTAMQDGMEGVTIVATANDITMLPPEFIRRFNEVFFVDLPGPDERWEVLEIHLKKRGRDIKNFEKDKEKLLKACDDYTGAEIEKAVKDAIAHAFHAKKKDVLRPSQSLRS